MLDRLLAQLRAYDMLSPGDSVTCAVSGGADSMALLWGMYLLRDKLNITLSAAHFNHHLRGARSDGDEAFVREFCARFDIPLAVGHGQIVAGKKGLEAAAREARYAFFAMLPGKLATAHTADDNAETVLMHLVRGTGLKGLGGIAPVNGRVLRPMLTVTRRQVEDFLMEYSIPHVEDESNAAEDFLRNRLRHGVMPLLRAENPRFSENVSRTAMVLRQDEQTLSDLAGETLPPVGRLRALPGALRARLLERFMREHGVPEPERGHIELAEKLIFSDKPSARASLPGGVTLCRSYDRLELAEARPPLEPVPLRPGLNKLGNGVEILVEPAERAAIRPDSFAVVPVGTLYVRSRCSGDAVRLSGGTKSLKKLFADRKIPAGLRPRVPVVCDDTGVIGALGVGMDLDRAAKSLPAVRITLIKTEAGGMPE